MKAIGESLLSEIAELHPMFYKYYKAKGRIVLVQVMLMQSLYIAKITIFTETDRN